MDYVKLRIDRDWGEQFYAYEDRRIHLNSSDSVPVLLNDGISANLSLCWIDKDGSYYDHGKQYQSTYKWPVLEAWYHGHRVLLELGDVAIHKQWVEARAFYYR